jgi:hypothetical protein
MGRIALAEGFPCHARSIAVRLERPRAGRS